jgi:hypothetical protein
MFTTEELLEVVAAAGVAVADTFSLTEEQAEAEFDAWVSALDAEMKDKDHWDFL